MTSSIHTNFYIPVALWEQMRADVIAHLPEEACGLLAGLGERARVVMPITNTLHSPVRFRLDARQQLDAFVWMENQALELVGIYHSHPAGPDAPSVTDLAECYYPEAVHLIWSPMKGDWLCRGYRIIDQSAAEVSLLVE